jgi:hypothetical protein
VHLALLIYRCFKKEMDDSRASRPRMWSQEATPMSCSRLNRPENGFLGSIAAASGESSATRTELGFITNSSAPAIGAIRRSRKLADNV